ncbi:hypothetical protein B0T25DRAFT_568576 [Lasiosphaeria hispida]|uniref:Uncharacterized protein n=1 Tax=Lasiosphaeria hispida TaxID=260671 RepID=A0AAJ0HIZ1_9PEZI|nr:hypothetical protein B0T25DRAFT_568576 [Lasiosphaeria hispida]
MPRNVMLSPQLSSCVPRSWDKEFVQYRENFYSPAENQTSEEYLRDVAGGGGYDTRRGSSERVLETIATFMESAAGYSKGPNFIHQTEVKNNKGAWEERPVALVYEWENKPLRLRQRGRVAPLTHTQLLVKLRSKRYVQPEPELEPSPDIETQPETRVEIDADRRLIYINNMDPVIISVLAQTTSCMETPVIQRTIFKHLTARTSFEAHIAVFSSYLAERDPLLMLKKARGFKTFSLELNISYFCLRRGGHPIRDQRGRWGGNGHLRETLCSPMDPTGPPSSPGASYNIYESQLSISVTGIDHWRWTAWAFIDTWFEPEDSVLDYYEEGESRAQPDPLAAGQVDINPPEKHPREYFLKVFEIRIREVEKEWTYILHVLQQDVQRIGANPLFTSPQRNFESEQGREKIRRLAAWNGEILRLVGALLMSLSRTLLAWDVFQKTDIGYFLYNDVACGEQPEQLLPSLRIIEKIFLNLHITHEEMEQTRLSLEELGRGLARGERNHSIFVQQRTGEHIKLLTWVTIGWSPVVIATGMCSAQVGIFPFRNNIGDFFGSVLIVGGLVGLTIAVLMSRHSNLVGWKIMSVSDSAAHLGYSRNADEPAAERDDAENELMSIPARIFTRQWTGASRVSSKTLV